MRTIDADALLAKIDERIKLVGLDTATKYGNETPEQADNSYQTWMKYEIADFVDDIRDEIVNAPTVDTTFREVVAYECGQKSVEEQPKGKWENTIPENPTNGDMLLTMFDAATVYGIDKENDCIAICMDNNFYQKFRYSWWNAPYKRGDV